VFLLLLDRYMREARACANGTSSRTGTGLGVRATTPTKPAILAIELSVSASIAAVRLT